MSTQFTHISNLPRLAPTEFSRFQSRLEQGLLRLAELQADCQNQIVAVNPIPPAADVWEAPPRDTVADRRAFPRRAGTCRVALCRLGAEDAFLFAQQIEWRLHATPLKGQLADLSLNGAAVLLSQPLQPGEIVVLRLICPRQDRFLDQQARVIRSLPEPDGDSKVMCHFRNKLSLEQVSFFSRFLNQSDWI